MTDLDRHGRAERPFVAGEPETLLGFLNYRRVTPAWKSRGRDAVVLRATVGAPTIPLGGLLKQVSFVEDFWLSRRLRGHDPAFRWAPGEWETDSKRSWRPAPEDTREQLYAQWQEAVTRSFRMIDDALAEGGLQVLARLPSPNGASASLRRLPVHVIEEYARHNGPADLIREAMDGEPGQ